MNIIMPKMGESVNEGTIIKWHKKIGDAVKRDEIIFEISTDKVDTEIPSPADGVLSQIIVNEGETVEVGTTVAVVQSNGEEVESSVNETPVEDSKVELSESMHDVIGKNIPGGSSESGEGIVEITMPKMGESVMEGTIIKWYKKVGDHVKKDETLFEISTDKVDTEIPSPEEGTLIEILVEEQKTVEVGTVVATLSSKAGATTSLKIDRSKAPNKQTEAPQIQEVKAEAPVHTEIDSVDVKKISSRFYTPLVLSVARKENISFEELEKINGTGQGGRVTKNDLLTYIEAKKAGKISHAKEVKKEVYVAPKEPLKFDASSSGDGIQKIEMDNIRQKIMHHMVRSRDTSVHVTAMIEVDMNRIHMFIQSKKEEFIKKENVKLTYMPFVAHAAVKGLKEFPLINSTIDGTTIYQKNFINLGIAVAIEPTGLIVPNIKDAGDKNIIGIARAINDLATRARTKKLSPDDISNGTFSITNYGVFGTLFGTPIINQPEVAILGVGAVQKKPVVLEIDGIETIAIKPIMALTLSHDHRLVDGMLGGKFLKFIKDTLENFDGRVY